MTHLATPAAAPGANPTKTPFARLGAPPAALRDHWAEVRHGLQAAVAELAPPVRQVATYHLGWTSLDGQPSQDGGGKYLRAALVLRGTEAVGGSASAGLPAAVAIELVHNGTLMQDDVMDLDRTRRHRPTAWTIYGTSQALLAGDALVILGLTVLLGAGSPHAVPAARLLADSYQRLVVGQTLDLGFESRATVPLDECYQMVEGKTAALLACATELGALLGGADAGTVDAMRQFGHHLGLAFQLVDDILGIWGDSACTGKPVGADIQARKKSLPVAYALAAGSGLVTDFYAQTDRPTPRQVAEITDALDALGARDWAEAGAQHHLRAAIASLDRAELHSESRDHLLELARIVTARTH